MIRQLKSQIFKTPFLALGGMAAGVLGIALLSQYGFGLRPCHLCLLQRYPYMGIIALCVAAHWLARTARTKNAVLTLLALAFFGESMFGFYHAGVEWGLVPGPASCTLSGMEGLSPLELLERIKGAPLVSCSQPAFVFLGLSMAGWNGVVALCLAGLTFIILRRNKNGNTSHDA